MADILSAVKSVRKQNESESNEAFLTPVRLKTPAEQDVPSTLEQDGDKRSDKTIELAVSPEEALVLLRSQPNSDQLFATLSQFRRHDFTQRPFNIHAPGPLQAQIINTLLNTIFPTFWPVLPEQSKRLLISCLTSVAGLNACVARLRLLISQKASEPIQDLLQAVKRLLDGDDLLLRLWTNSRTAIQDEGKLNMSWKEAVSLLGSGKIASVVAQAEEVCNRRSSLSSGAAYATWLGRNVAQLLALNERAAEHGTQVFVKALSLGYPSQLLQGLFESLLPGGAQATGTRLAHFLDDLPLHSKRTFTEHALRWLSNVAINDREHLEREDEDVSAVAGVLAGLIVDTAIKQHILSALTDPSLSSGLSLITKRATIASIASSDDEVDIQQLLEKLTSTFSDQLFINHSPVLQQESVAQTILLVAGYVHRKAPMALLLTARSSHHMQGVSNRLDCSNRRARWLGMVVGTAISSLVDKEGAKMKFGTDEMETQEAVRYLNLTQVNDTVGTMEDFVEMLAKQSRQIRRPKRAAPTVDSEAVRKINGKPVFGPPRPPMSQTEVIGEKVTEILDDEAEEDEEDALKPYAKPDSDPEDSDEDATLVNRNKIRPPVYVRDLMSMLRDDQKPDRFQLGIKHAAPLIRRKAGYGKEVHDHAEELASIFCNLQDPFDTQDFEELKLQALIAILLSNVSTMVPWLSKQSFTGDYSISQRCIFLSALGLGGRELAGLTDGDELNPIPSNASFPSKRLPAHLHSIYSTPTTASSTKRLEAASKDIERGLIKPLALQAADQSTAHLNAVKVRTFSSRMDVERTKRKPAPNQLAKVFGATFFFPLTGRYQQEISAYGSGSVYASVPFVLVTFLKTLALLLHASGPATLNLSAITSEFWELLLSLRMQAVQDISVLQAVLFSLLTLLEVNDANKQRIAEEQPKQLMETQQWVDLVFEGTGGGDLISENGRNEDEGKVRTLAAGVLVKTREVIEAYQKLLVGYSYD